MKGVCVYTERYGQRSIRTVTKGFGQKWAFFRKRKTVPLAHYIYTKKSKNVTCHKSRQFCVYITQQNKESIMKKTLLNITETSSQYVITWVFNEIMERWEIEDIEKV